MDIKRIKEQLTQHLNDLLENQPVFLVEVSVAKNKIDITLDGDTGIGIDQCGEVSNKISTFIDENNLMPDNKYNLMVSSPGAEKPLRLLRQYPKHIGRTIEILSNENPTPLKGILKTTDNNTVGIEYKQKIKGKKIELITHNIAFEDIKEAKINIAFK